MKTTIRMGSFETNSSSTHAIVIMRTSDVPAWERGELVWDHHNQELVTPEELVSRYPDELYYDGASFVPFVTDDLSDWEQSERAAFAETLNNEHFYAPGYCSAWLEAKSTLDGVAAFSFEATNEF